MVDGLGGAGAAVGPDQTVGPREDLDVGAVLISEVAHGCPSGQWAVGAEGAGRGTGRTGEGSLSALGVPVGLGRLGAHDVVQQFARAQDLDRLAVLGGNDVGGAGGDGVDDAFGQACPHLEGGVVVGAAEVHPRPGPVGARGYQLGQLGQRAHQGVGRLLDDSGHLVRGGVLLQANHHAGQRVRVGGRRRDVADLERRFGGECRAVREADVVLHSGTDCLADGGVVVGHGNSCMGRAGPGWVTRRDAARQR